MFGAYDMQRDGLVGTFAAKKNWISFYYSAKQRFAAKHEPAFLKWFK